MDNQLEYIIALLVISLLLYTRPNVLVNFSKTTLGKIILLVTLVIGTLRSTLHGILIALVIVVFAEQIYEGFTGTTTASTPTPSNDPLSDYIEYPNSDFLAAGGVIGSVPGPTTADEMAKTCDANPVCGGFTNNPTIGGGWFKGAINQNAKSHAASGLNLYAKKKAPWPQTGKSDLPGYNEYLGYDYVPTTLYAVPGPTSAAEMAKTCDANTDCGGFNHNPTAGGGWFKKAINTWNLSSNPSLNLYKKLVPGSKPPPSPMPQPPPPPPPPPSPTPTPAPTPKAGTIPGKWTGAGGSKWGPGWTCENPNTASAYSYKNEDWVNCDTSAKKLDEDYTFSPGPDVKQGAGWSGNTCAKGGTIPITVADGVSTLTCVGPSSPSSKPSPASIIPIIAPGNYIITTLDKKYMLTYPKSNIQLTQSNLTDSTVFWKFTPTGTDSNTYLIQGTYKCPTDPRCNNYLSYSDSIVNVSTNKISWAIKTSPSNINSYTIQTVNRSGGALWLSFDTEMQAGAIKLGGGSDYSKMSFLIIPEKSWNPTPIIHGVPVPAPTPKAGTIPGKWSGEGGSKWGPGWTCENPNIASAYSYKNEHWVNCDTSEKKLDEDFTFSPGPDVKQGAGWSGNTCATGGTIPITVSSGVSTLTCVGPSSPSSKPGPTPTPTPTPPPTPTPTPAPTPKAGTIPGKWTGAGGSKWGPGWTCENPNTASAYSYKNEHWVNCDTSSKNLDEDFTFSPGPDVKQGAGWSGNTCAKGGTIPITVSGGVSTLTCVGPSSHTILPGVVTPPHHTILPGVVTPHQHSILPGESYSETKVGKQHIFQMPASYNSSTDSDMMKITFDNCKTGC